MELGETISLRNAETAAGGRKLEGSYPRSGRGQAIVDHV